MNKTLLKRAELLENMSRKKEAFSAYNDIITFSVEEHYPIGRANVSNAYYKKGCLLEETGNFEEALETYNEFISTCKSHNG